MPSEAVGRAKQLLSDADWCRACKVEPPPFPAQVLRDLIAESVDLDAVRDQVAASVRAEVLILSYTPHMTGADLVGAVIRDAKLWVERGIGVYSEKRARSLELPLRDDDPRSEHL